MDVLDCKGAMLSLKDNILYYQDKTIELTKTSLKFFIY